MTGSAPVDQAASDPEVALLGSTPISRGYSQAVSSSEKARSTGAAHVTIHSQLG